MISNMAMGTMYGRQHADEFRILVELYGEEEAERAYPPFPEWLRRTIKLKISKGEEVDEELMALSQEPSRRARTFTAMWAYGNHYRTIPRGSMVTHLTNDTGIACIQDVGHNVAVAERSILMANLEKVGTLREIIVVSYSSKPKAIMVGNWIKESDITRDAHGLWIAQMDSIKDHDISPYVLPGQVSQVCYLK